MSFYTPEFSDAAAEQFRQFNRPLQEAVLDLIEAMLTVAPPPAVARRLSQPVVEVSDADVTVADRDWFLFVRAELDLAGRRFRVMSITAVPR